MATTTFGTQLRTAREARGWSRETLARQSGTSAPAIARTELYGTQPRLSTLEAWAKALELPLAVLLGPAEAPAWAEFRAKHGCCPDCAQPTWHNGDPCPNAPAVAS
jgi:transcriptional regulator with XRE-family HTH domain